jgi:hypothetical protein
VLDFQLWAGTFLLLGFLLLIHNSLLAESFTIVKGLKLSMYHSQVLESRIRKPSLTHLFPPHQSTAGLSGAPVVGVEIPQQCDVAKAVEPVVLVNNERIGHFFGLTYSSVSHIVRSTRNRLEHDRGLKKKYKKIYSQFNGLLPKEVCL